MLDGGHTLGAPSAPRPPVARDNASPHRTPAIAGSHLFREEVLKAYLNGDDDPTILRAAPPSTTALVAVCGVIVALLVAVAAFGRVEITSRGRGVLRAEGGAQALVTLAPATVAEVRGRSGDRVERGQPVVVLESASVKAALLEADRKVALAERSLREYREKRRPLLDRQRVELARRGAALASRVDQEAYDVARADAAVARTKALSDAAMATAADRDKADEDRSRAVEQRLTTTEQVARVRAERAALDLEIANEEWRLESALSDAATRRAAVAFALEQTTIASPRPGTIESLTVRPGDALAAGATVARVVPSDVPLQIVAFVPERDRAFLREGATAIVELDQLPATEFGTLRATVARIARDIAPERDLRDVLGEIATATGPMYRVELTLDDDERRARVDSYIRAGSVVSIRYVLRRRTIAAILFAPLRRILE